MLKPIANRTVHGEPDRSLSSIDKHFVFKLVSACRDEILINLLPLIYLHQASVTVVYLDTVEVLCRYLRLQNVHEFLILSLCLLLYHIAASFGLLSKLNQRVFPPLRHLLSVHQALKDNLAIIRLFPDLKR